MSTKEKAFNRFLDSNQCKNRQKLQQCVRESSKADKQILRYENVDCSHKDSWLLLCPDHHSSESHSLVTTIQVVRILNTFYFYRLPGEPFIAEGNYLLGHVVTITPFYFPFRFSLMVTLAEFELASWFVQIRVHLKNCSYSTSIVEN